MYEPKSLVIHVEGSSQGTDTESESAGKRHQKINQGKFVEKWRSVLAGQLDNPGYERARLASDRRHDAPHALIVDHMVPMRDRDAGSLRMYHLIRNLLELGWRVTLIPDNFGAPEPYTSELQGLGVEVLYGSVNVPLNIAEHGPVDAPGDPEPSLRRRRATCISSASTRPPPGWPTTRSTSITCASSAARSSRAIRRTKSVARLQGARARAWLAPAT